MKFRTMKPSIDVLPLKQRNNLGMGFPPQENAVLLIISLSQCFRGKLFCLKFLASDKFPLKPKGWQYNNH